MTRHDNEYDAIILGSGIGGLIAATVLAKQKRSVLLLKEKGYQRYCVREGFRFVPFSNFSESYLRKGLLDKIGEAIDLPLPDPSADEGNSSRFETKKSKEKVSFQVILPKSRIDLYLEPPLFQSEWKREFPQEFEKIKSFYTEMGRTADLFKTVEAKESPQSLFPIRQYSFFKNLFSIILDPLPRGEIKGKLSGLSKEFKKFIELQLLFHGNLHIPRIPLSFAAYGLDDGNESVLKIESGRLEEKVSEQFRRFGGRIEEVGNIEEIFLEKGRKVVYTRGGGEEKAQSKCLIINCPLYRLSALLGKRGKSLSKMERRIRPKYFILPFFFGIQKKVVPVGMGDVLISLSDLERPPEWGNLLFIGLNSKGDKGAAPENKTALTVESLFPFNPREEWEPDAFARHQKGVLNHLFRLFPFLEDHIEFADMKWAEEQIGRWSYPHLCYETLSNFNWREGLIPNRLSKNFYFIGKENFPYLGAEGEIIAGLMTARTFLEEYR
jgi:prolycopene isomerase